MAASYLPVYVRRALIIVASLAVVLYLAALLLLYTHQRQILFIPDPGPAGPPPPGFSARVVAVPGAGTVLTWVLPAATRKDPTFVIFTGNEARITDFVATGERLNANGWGVVLASYRGYSGNPGEPSEAGLLQDARTVLASLLPHGPLIVWGHSLGSGVAARMASEARAQALVLEAAYTSVADVAARRYWMFPVRWLARDPFETEKLVPKITVPVLLFHGTDDPVVPFDMGERLAQEFGARATFVPVPDGGHVPHQFDLEPAVAQWMERQKLGEPAKTGAP